MAPSPSCERGAESRSYQPPDMSWQQLIEHVKQQRRRRQQKMSQYYYSSFTLRTDETGEHARVYCLGTPATSSDSGPTLLCADVPRNSAQGDQPETVQWRPLLNATEPFVCERAAAAANAEVTRAAADSADEDIVYYGREGPQPGEGADESHSQCANGGGGGAETREQEQLRERSRATMRAGGLTSYTIDGASGTVVFTASTTLYRCVDAGGGTGQQQHEHSEPVDTSPFERPGGVQGSPLRVAAGGGDNEQQRACPMDVQMSADAHWLAFVLSGDLHIVPLMGRRQRYIRVTDYACSLSNVSAQPSFVIQEEFNRYSAIWWSPKEHDSARYVLFEQTDESPVGRIQLGAAGSANIETIRYPLAGCQNATSSLRLVRCALCTGSTGSDDISLWLSPHALHVVDAVPGAEYLVRAGWTPDALGVWFQTMNRKQDVYTLCYVPIEQFTTGRFQPVVLYVENAEPFPWVNYHDNLCFVPKHCSPETLVFLWTSESDSRNGMNNILRVSTPRLANNLWNDAASVNRKAVTDFDWPVNRRLDLVLDERRDLVYFTGTGPRSVDSHIYCASVSPSQQPPLWRQLTPAGRGTWRPAEFGARPALHADYGMVVWHSRVDMHSAQCLVYRFVWSADDALPHAVVVAQLVQHCGNELQMDCSAASNSNAGGGGMSRQASSSSLCTANEMPPPAGNAPNSDVPAPVIVSYRSSLDSTGCGGNALRYAYFYPPANGRRDTKHPVLLYVYAGPEVQLVVDAADRRMDLARWQSLGFAGVMVDGRGSANRGLAFESQIYQHMGQIEVDDQVEALRRLADEPDVLAHCQLDFDRLFVVGASYGGYVALNCIRSRPDVFQAAVSISPVVAWHLYDTGYTERYMGLPDDSAAHAAYRLGNAALHAEQFPNDDGRVLVIVGLRDDNVLLAHTELLVGSLQRARRHCALHAFPAERHGMRQSCNADVCDAQQIRFVLDRIDRLNRARLL